VSVERRGRSWRVRYRDDNGSNRSHAFDLRRDAETFEREIRRRKALGDLASLDAGKQSLNEFLDEWLHRYALPTLSEKTLVDYCSVYDRHIGPRLGQMPLRAITPALIDDLHAHLRADGIGRPTVIKVLFLLSGILGKAELWGYLARNPVRAVPKPSQRRSRVVRPLPPSVVEIIRSVLLSSGQRGDATLVSVLAYAGLRPGEALALQWRDIRERTIVVDKAVSLGKVKDTKTRAARAVRLLSPLASDLKDWHLASGMPAPAALVFPAHNGREFSDDDLRNWRRRVFKPAATAAGLSDARPYDLRHSFVSLLITEGTHVIEVARQAGHSPSMSLDTYGHVFDEATGAEASSAEAAILAARRVPATYPRSQSSTDLASA
jgi:integrase